MPVHTFKCSSCGWMAEEYFKLSTHVPGSIPCPHCQDRQATREFPNVWTERDFPKPIDCITRPVHTAAHARRMEAACPDVEVVLDEDGQTYVPRLRNQAAKRQLYKYLGLEEKK